ncbi:winged helix-turn-helix domain-containing protein [Citromicrobium bathyomarinum]|uniref:winged helix-turn-helix domain-containing protein n=1 Tax=Citromicrobium bathyomarinum TaxID=72174 RepID=UPI00315A4241
MPHHTCPHCGEELVEDISIAYGNITVEDHGVLYFQGRRLELPRVQHQIVEALIAAKGRALTRSYLAEWLDGDVFDQSISVYVGRVRATFKEIDPGFDQIVSVRGFAAYKWAFKSRRGLRKAH